MNYNPGHPSAHPAPATTPSRWADGTVVGTLIARGIEPPSVQLRAEQGRLAGMGPVEPDLLATSRGRGNYRVLGEIGRDALSYVLQVEDSDLGRTVAMKVLRDEHLTNPLATRVFVQEAQVASQLQHEGILPVYDFGLHPDGRPYYTMKVVRGASLSMLLAARPSTETDSRRFLSIFEQVCKAIAYAHARGVAHCALDPQHIIVGDQGETQVVHWASARFLATDAAGRRAEYRPLAAPENAAYMAPEAARGSFEACDERTDVFALGSILCEILTGAPAYVGRSETEVRSAAGQARLDDAFRRLDLCEGSQELVALAKGCLVAGQSSRPQSAMEVLASLDLRLVSLEDRRGQAEFSARVALDEAGRERRTARKSRILAEAALLVGLLGAAGAYFRFEHRERQREFAVAEIQQEVECAQFLWRQAQSSTGTDTALWDEALLAASRATSDLDQPGVDAALKKRVEFVADTLRLERNAALERIADERRDRELLAALGSAAVAHGDQLSTLDQARLASRYAEIFEAFDLNPELGEEERIANAIGRSAVRAEILTSFDRWAVASALAGQPEAEALLRVAAQADENPLRNALRDALGSQDETRALAVIEALDPLDIEPQTAELAAWTLRQHGRFDEAIALLRAVHTRAPGDYSLNFQLAECFEEEPVRDWSQAVRFYTSALGGRPDSTDARYRLSRALEQEGRIDESMRVLQAAIADRPDDVALQAHLGSLHLALGERQRAVEIWRRAAQFEHAQPSGLAMLGEDLRRAGDLPGAGLALAKWVQAAPEDAHAHVALGALLREQGQLDEAARVLDQAGELEPDWAQAPIELGDVYAKMGRTDEAIESYFQALRLQPECASLHRKLGRAFEAREEWDSAAVALKDSLILDPAHDETAQRLFALLCEDVKNPRAAVQAFLEITEAQETSAMGWYYLGRSQIALGDRDAGASALLASVDLRPDDPRSRALLGRVQLELGQAAGALAHLRAAVRLEPDRVQARTDLGIALSREGELDAAVEAFRGVLAVEPNAADVHYRLGGVQQRAGDLEGARSSYLQAVRLRPGHAEAHCSLGGLLRQQGEYVASLDVYLLGHELGSRRSDWTHPSEEWVAEAERLVAAQDQLEAVVQGGTPPREPEALVRLASMAQRKGLNGTSARLYATAMKETSLSASKGLVCDRYQAACAAAQASTGAGDDAVGLTSKERARWRTTAVSWLERELIGLLRQNADGVTSDQELRSVLERWTTDPALGAVRDASALAALPEEERGELSSFWTRVTGLLAGD